MRDSFGSLSTTWRAMKSGDDLQKKLQVELTQLAKDQVAFAGKDFGRATESHPIHGTIPADRLLFLVSITAAQAFAT